jgi:hypothetical protein
MPKGIQEGIAKLQFGSKFVLALPDLIFREEPLPSSDMITLRKIKPALRSPNFDREASFAILLKYQFLKILRYNV